MKWCAFLATALLLFGGAHSSAAAYSVLAHEALVDEAWSEQIAPLLTRRFRRASTQEVEAARAFAYGGSLIQDLGYYPFGSRFFSNLVHYVRSGDFVTALIAESRTLEEYAFSLGALAHYASDNAAHPAVNHALPMIYPKLREKFSGDVLFGESPTRHVMAEFAFDVVQVARGQFKSDAYQRLIGFEVARPLLERAFRVTYGLELKDIFGDVDLAIGTYRRAASQVIPDVTRIAWREKRDEIVSVTPDVTERDFVYTMTRQEYEEAFGTGYRKPGLLVRLVVAVFKVLPKFGPFKPLAFEPLPPETERMFLESFGASLNQYRQLLRSLQDGRLSLRNTDLDTGARPVRSRNALADETYAELIKKLEKVKYAGASPGLRSALGEHYGTARRATRSAPETRRGTTPLGPSTSSR
jgi:Zinc dependent phospholipase C